MIITGYAVAFTACMIAQPTSCLQKEVVLPPEAGMGACMKFSQEIAAEWQMTWAKKRWFVKTSDGLKCKPVVPEKKQIDI